jgi:hypothetical protein
MHSGFVTKYRHGVLTGKHLLVAYPPHVPTARL